jgi:hypothetical protein
VIIWDKGFTKPVEEHPPEEDEDEDEDIVFSSFPCVDALEDIEELIKDEQKSYKGFGNQ